MLIVKSTVKQGLLGAWVYLYMAHDLKLAQEGISLKKHKSTKSSIITTLKHFKIKIKAEQLIYKQLLSTFSIFHAKQTKEWVSPPLLKP